MKRKVANVKEKEKRAKARRTIAQDHFKQINKQTYTKKSGFLEPKRKEKTGGTSVLHDALNQNSKVVS